MKYTIRHYPEVRDAVDALSVEELIAAVTCPNVSDDLPDIYRNTATVFLHSAADDVIQKRISDINHDRNHPAIIMTDIESGVGGIVDGGTLFPSLMACAKAGSEKLAYEMGRISALEASRVGYGWGLGPVVDILGDIDNPITSTRSAGETSSHVEKFAGACMRGMQDHGLIATAKHFPGDGYCKYDQHLTTTENPLEFSEWMDTYGRIYRSMIESGIKSVMPGHISLPSYDERDADTGMHPPATLSKKLLTGLLKTELGFEGIIISDAVNMTGFCGYMNFYKACATFLLAGGDCLLFVHPDELFVQEMRGLIASGVLSIEILKDRAYRMMCFAREHEYNAPAATWDPAEHQAVADEITAGSLEVARDRRGIIPFKIAEETRVLHLIVKSPDEIEKIDGEIFDEIKKYSAHVEQMTDPGPEKILNAIRAKQFDLVICTVGNKAKYGTNVIRLHGAVARNMMGGWTKYDTPVIFVSTHHPCLHLEYNAAVDTAVNTYGVSVTTAPELLRLITGNKIMQSTRRD